MSKPIPLDPTSRRLLEYVENLADEIRSGEVVGILTVIVSDNADIRHEAAGLFHDGYAMVGHLEGLKAAMLYMEADDFDDEEYLDDEE
tara:strand:+ start:10322 stop:10585 length:264 start_codon:yes stop_codon:yes gene_type:complete